MNEIFLIHLTCSIAIFLQKPFAQFWDMFVVHLTDRTSWGRLHLPSGDFGSFSSAYLVQLQYYSSLTSWSVWSCFGKGLSWFLGESGFLQGFVALQYVAFIFQALHHMEPQREGSDGVGPIRLGCISSPFRAHGKEGLDGCFQFPMIVGWCLKIRDTHVQNAISLVFPD